MVSHHGQVYVESMELKDHDSHSEGGGGRWAWAPEVIDMSGVVEGNNLKHPRSKKPP